jgi:hypothetical protein
VNGNPSVGEVSGNSGKGGAYVSLSPHQRPYEELCGSVSNQAGGIGRSGSLVTSRNPSVATDARHWRRSPHKTCAYLCIVLHFASLVCCVSLQAGVVNVATRGGTRSSEAGTNGVNHYNNLSISLETGDGHLLELTDQANSEAKHGNKSVPYMPAATTPPSTVLQPPCAIHFIRAVCYSPAIPPYSGSIASLSTFSPSVACKAHGVQNKGFKLRRHRSHIAIRYEPTSAIALSH